MRDDDSDDSDADEDWSAKDPNEDRPRPPPPTSSKIQHLISLLNLIPSTEKSLVFSQYTKFLDLIAAHLELAGYVPVHPSSPTLSPLLF